MADKMTVMKKWIDDIRKDDNLEVTEQELAYIVYAAITFGLEGEKVNIGEVFGKEFKHLNFAMSNIYGQIENIQNYGEEKKASVLKYDADRIYELRLQGYTAKEICVMEGYGEDKANNITSNKGWKLAGEELKKRGVQKSGNSGKSVQKLVQTGTDVMQNADGGSFDF
jgi:hypothetical protein